MRWCRSDELTFPPPRALTGGLPRLCVAAMALLGLLTLATGCIVVPIPSNRIDLSARTNIAPQLVQQLGPAQLSRAQVLLELGEPDQVSADEREFRFHTERIKWDIYWAVAGEGGGASGDIEIRRYYDLVLRFNPTGNLVEAAWLEGSSPQHLQPTTTFQGTAEVNQTER